MWLWLVQQIPRTRQNYTCWLSGQNLGPILDTKKIRSSFKIIGIWPLNPKTMDNRITPSTIYITTSTTSRNEEGEGEKGEGEADYISSDQVG